MLTRVVRRVRTRQHVKYSTPPLAMVYTSKHSPSPLTIFRTSKETVVTHRLNNTQLVGKIIDAAVSALSVLLPVAALVATFGPILASRGRAANRRQEKRTGD
jgi:hypothetical protein